MNNETVKILANQMEIPPDDLISTDKKFRENEAKAIHADPDKAEFVSSMIEDMKTVMADDTLSMGVRLGYILSTAGIAVARAAEQMPSQVFQEMADRCVVQEEMFHVKHMISSLFNMPSSLDAPDCPECGDTAFWCVMHEMWECPNALCEHTGAIEPDSDE